MTTAPLIFPAPKRFSAYFWHRCTFREHFRCTFREHVNIFSVHNSSVFHYFVLIPEQPIPHRWWPLMFFHFRQLSLPPRTFAGRGGIRTTFRNLRRSFAHDSGAIPRSIPQSHRLLLSGIHLNGHLHPQFMFSYVEFLPLFLFVCRFLLQS